MGHITALSIEHHSLNLKVCNPVIPSWLLAVEVLDAGEIDVGTIDFIVVVILAEPICTEYFNYHASCLRPLHVS